MALVIGTNCGFVSAAPVADPAGSSGGSLDNQAVFTRDTSPSGSYNVTEIGWWQWRDDISAAQFNVGIYSNNAVPTPDEPNVLIANQSTGNSTTALTAAWYKYTSLSIGLTSSTLYWIAVGIQDVVNFNATHYTGVAGALCGTCPITGPTLEDPYDGTGDALVADYVYGVYAKYAAAAGTAAPILLHPGMDGGMNERMSGGINA